MCRDFGSYSFITDKCFDISAWSEGLGFDTKFRKLHFFKLKMIGNLFQIIPIIPNSMNVESP